MHRHRPIMVDYVSPPEAPGKFSHALYIITHYPKVAYQPDCKSLRLLMAVHPAVRDMPCILPAAHAAGQIGFRHQLPELRLIHGAFRHPDPVGHAAGHAPCTWQAGSTLRDSGPNPLRHWLRAARSALTRALLI